MRVLFTLTLLLSSFLVYPQSKVKIHEGVVIGGIKQWIGDSGANDTKPLLLFLHGGPGFSSRSYSKKLVKALKKDFIVAQWDQRETGITKAWNASKDSLTLSLMHRDTEEVVDYLLKKFNKEKLYLLGYSWGGFLGFEYASTHPDKLHAFIPLSAMIHAQGSEQRTRALLIQKASEIENQEALLELKAIDLPSSNWKEMYLLRKWTTKLLEGKEKDTSNPVSLYKPWAATWFPLYTEASRVNYIKTVPKIECPVFFIQGANDFIAHYQLAQDYYNLLDAPDKKFIMMTNVGHNIPSEKPKELATTIIGLKI